MKIYDISVPLQDGSFTFPGDPNTQVSSFLSKEKGDLANVSLISMGTHSGTHIDPPRHLWVGATGADAVPLETLIGPATVIELDSEPEISARSLASMVGSRSLDRLLIKTRNSHLWRLGQFQEDFVYLSAEGAEWLVNHGVKLVGFDYLSLENYASSVLTSHETLLRAGIVVVEGLDLSRVTPGNYILACLPLRIVNGDGAPARAVLIEE